MQLLKYFFLAFAGLLSITQTLWAQDMPKQQDALLLYQQIEASETINFEAFKQAINGYNQLEKTNNHLLTIVDFSKASTEERLYVIDLNEKRILFQSHVAHGVNSGDNMATSFSNRSGSYQSSLGFYRTAETYQGRNGYSLRLDGLEPDINDNARARAVVIHGANYANPEGVESRGRLGRSYGCPALPQKLNRPIIDAIKNGSILFIYAENQDYQNQSQYRIKS